MRSARRSREGQSIDRSVRSALLQARFRSQAWWQARKDIRDTVTIQFEGPNGMFASTPFIRELHAAAQRAAHQIRAQLELAEADLLAEIEVLAAAVVRHGDRETVHHQRLRRSLSSWDRAVRREGKRLDATIAGLDQIQGAYWSRLASGHRTLREVLPRGPMRARPNPLTSAGLWQSSLSILRTGRPDPGPGVPSPTVVNQAIEIVFREAS